MKDLIERLEKNRDWVRGDVELGLLLSEAAAALRECAKQEPVAWMYQHDETGRTVILTATEEGQHLGPRWHFVSPLYAAPVPQRIDEGRERLLALLEGK